MNAVSLILALLAIVVFLGGTRFNRPYVDTGLGLALLTSAWIITLMWTTSHLLHVG